jgi:hypothetical protein
MSTDASIDIGLWRAGAKWRSASTLLRRVRNTLDFLIFFLELPLHLKISLSLSFDALLLHVSNDSSVHCLCMISTCPGALRRDMLQLSLQSEPNVRN